MIYFLYGLDVNKRITGIIGYVVVINFKPTITYF